jgi:predicted aspartyl protease
MRATRFLNLLSAALLLAACSTPTLDDPVAAPIRQAACKVDRVVDLPTRYVEGAILVPARIDGHPVQLQVDTGAMTSMLTPEAAFAMGLRDDPHRTTIIHGVGGTITTRNVLVHNFDVGGRVWQSESIVTGHIARKFRETPPVAGLLGVDRLGIFDIELDLPNHRLTLWEVSNCSGDFVPWRQPHDVVSLLNYGRRQMVTTVRFGETPVPALIDWGARSSVMTVETASRLGVTPAQLAKDPVADSHGVDQTEIPVRIHEFSNVRIGAQVFPKARIQVGELKLTGAGMLLGIDYASVRHIWLSYNSQQMFVARRPAPPTKPPGS